MSNLSKPLTSIFLTVRPCPRRKATHLALEFKSLPKPDREGYTHAAKCPVNGEWIRTKNEG